MAAPLMGWFEIITGPRQIQCRTGHIPIRRRGEPLDDPGDGLDGEADLLGGREPAEPEPEAGLNPTSVLPRAK
jgi:hypothetical protein